MRIANARTLAYRRHAGELDRRGGHRLYLDHLEQVAERVRAAGGGRTEVAAAYLHGLSAHFGLSAGELAAEGVPPHVVTIVRTLTVHRCDVLTVTACAGAEPVLRACLTDRIETGDPDTTWRRHTLLLATLDLPRLRAEGEPAVTRLLTALAGPPGSDEWWYALCALAGLRAPQAVLPLFDLLETDLDEPSGSWHGERWHAVEDAIRRIMTGSGTRYWSPSPPTDPRWLPTLRSLAEGTTGESRALATELLAYVAGPEGDAYVLRAITDPDHRTRSAAYREAGRRRLPGAIEPLRRALTDPPGSYEQVRAAAALGDFGDPAYAELLLPVLCGSSPMAADAAAHALVTMAHPDAAAVALRGLRSDRPFHCRPHAAWVVGEYRLQAAVPDLIAAAPPGNGQLTTEAVEALGKIADPAAVPVLREAFDRHKDPHVRRMALWGLVRIGAAHAPETVLAAADDPDPDLRRLAVPALADVPGDAALLRLIAACRETRSRAALRALISRPDSRAIPTLITVMAETRDRRIRHLAGRALEAVLADGHSIPWNLLPAYHGRDVQLRRCAVWLRARLNNDPGVPLWLLGDPDPGVRAETAAALARGPSDSAETVQALMRALTDPAARVRAKAAIALGARTPTPEIQDALRAAATADPHPSARQAATAALRP